MLIEQLKEKYEKALDEFIPLRNKEVDDDEGLTETEVKRYVELVEESLLPLSQQLHELGEDKYLNENSFSYEF